PADSAGSGEAGGLGGAGGVGGAGLASVPAVPGVPRAIAPSPPSREAPVTDAAAIDPQAAFADLGLTSTGAMALGHRLGLRTGLRLPATLVRDHPTPAAVAAHLDERLYGRRSGTGRVGRPSSRPGPAGPTPA
ncbi:acyl carrier protein, partial [Streptomyces sp. NRRL B-24085]|uniref:acyl carrier protein n=1 Tax=Streptomyces sp. NRRL B-24085 TaxID=1709476 RepID=UPI000B2EAEB2